MNNLQVTRGDKIAQIRVRQHGVELEDVEKGAVLCVRADVKVLQRLSDKTYVIQNGPYHRKFLDGYYPYHVSLTVHYSKNEIQFRQVLPQEQDGFDVTESKDGLSIDSWFKGVLRIRLEFLENGS
jgi:translation elongation factor EF-Tu-like GTPase